MKDSNSYFSFNVHNNLLTPKKSLAAHHNIQYALCKDSTLKDSISSFSFTVHKDLFSVFTYIHY